MSTLRSPLECTRAPGCAQIEFPIAIIDRNVDKQGPAARAAAEAFVQYCYTPEAQREFCRLRLQVSSKPSV